MPLRSLSLIIVISVLAVPSLGQATTCQQWGRLDEAGKIAAVEQMTSRRIHSGVAQQYGVSKPKVERCLLSQKQAIIYSFDDLCADSRTAGMKAIEVKMDEWVMTCVNS